MANDDQVKDESSIKPVSSLRSRFENMTTQCQPVQSTPPPSVRRSLDLPRPLPRPDPTPDNTSQASKKARPPPPRARPVSTAYPLTPRHSPPTVSVQSPASPPRNLDIRVTIATPSKSPPTSTLSTPGSNNASPAGSIRHFRTPSRVTTPALEARMSAFLQSSQSSASTPVESKPQSNGEHRPKSPNFGGPPPVNRAGKPKIGNLPSASVESLAPMVASRTGSTQISPFGTPPSSSESTPHAEQTIPAIPTDSKPRNQSASHGYFAGVVAPRPAPVQYRNPSPKPLSRSYDSSSFHPSRLQQIPQRAPISVQDGTNEEEAPSLPPRPEREMHSGRTSPTRFNNKIPARQSLDIPRRASAVAANTDSTMMPPPRRAQPPPLQTSASALSQGFDRRHSVTPAATPSSSKPPPPAIPAPRRSVDTRREDFRSIPSTPMLTHHADDVEDPPVNYPGGNPQDFPDASQANRRPPRFKSRPWDINTGYDTRTFAVCGDLVCTTGYITRVWSLRTGESCLTLSHGDNVKVTALAFAPTADAEDEGRRLWLGTNIGEIHEVDIPTQSIVRSKPNAHPRREIIRIFRHGSELWSLDDDGKLNVWSPGSTGMPSLDTTPTTFRALRGHSCSVIVGGHLWLAAGKEIRVFKPSAATEAAFNVLQKPLVAEGAGDITAGAIIPSKPDLVYFGHADGKVSVYQHRDFKCVGVFSISPYKISSLAGAGDYLWAGYTAGTIFVYDTSTTPWRVMKDWVAHDNPICSILTDTQSIWKMDNRLQVVSLGLDNAIRVWDGMLREDWLETKMQQNDSEFCSFEEITAGVLTWNAGAVKPNHLKGSERDAAFFRDYFSSNTPPDILIFGFQELVDLENKKVTAKSFFKSRKKDPTEQEHMSHQYRAWRDHLTRCIEDFMPATHGYTLLHTSSMVGLFSCVFVKTSLRARIKQVHTAEVKRGMGGLHGNKGALIIRMIVDDSSVCLINCHLAAGQTQTLHRNNDVAAILEAECLPVAAVSNTAGTFVGGGDGSMILDHEICILNGDLNYRIDAMPRDTVVRAVNERNLAKLLERDQLLLSRRKNPAFRLRVFQELPITFAPTYKYNVGTDDYDTSEKKRAPAWCDRVLYRGMGRIKCEDYRRWEVRVSDHRPVSARLRIRIKKVDEQRRVAAWSRREKEFEKYSGRIAGEAKLDYLTNILGLPRKEAMNLLKG
ncbi:DNase I-like protein [Aureobasidium pullulans]|nr:DNase I-like protein [Aureobasidium pullulans]